MTDGIVMLAGTAASIGFVHTILGPDHYIPFIAMSKARGWSPVRTAWITALCGLGHVLSSIVLGFAGILLGTVVFRLESIESIRGDIAGWFLIAFGLVYMLWGLRRAIRGRSHTHLHRHGDGEAHDHAHSHVEDHSHAHGAAGKRKLTPWVLFTIFVLGPCEPLIPLIMYPAARSSMSSVVIVALTFGTVTLVTMLGCVFAGIYGLSRISFPQMHRYTHAFAGFAVLLCGCSIKFLGL